MRPHIECDRDVNLSPKKKRKVGNSSTVAETKKMYYTIQVVMESMTIKGP